MNSLEALILGLIQGLTEFLPVSSSGHLMIGKALLGVEVTEDLVFEVTVHAATVLATLVVFRKAIRGYLKDLLPVRVDGRLRFVYNDGVDYLLKIGVSMIPVFVVGVFFKDAVTALFSSMTVVGCCLIVTSVLLFLSDRPLSFRRAGAEKASGKPAGAPRGGISYLQAFVVGIGQSVAVLPGLSRSGTTISTGLLCGVRRDVMAQFSFLMVLVPILGETFLDVVGGDMAASAVGVLPLLIGFVAAFFSGLFACRVMIALVRRAQLKWFGLYCALAGLLVLIFLA